MMKKAKEILEFIEKRCIELVGHDTISDLSLGQYNGLIKELDKYLIESKNGKIKKKQNENFFYFIEVTFDDSENIHTRQITVEIEKGDKRDFIQYVKDSIIREYPNARDFAVNNIIKL
jgi:hypothetical protein